MKFNVEERACELAEYIIENRATVRAAAKRFGISKSTVHKDVTERLRDIDLSLYSKVREIPSRIKVNVTYAEAWLQSRNMRT